MAKENKRRMEIFTLDFQFSFRYSAAWWQAFRPYYHEKYDINDTYVERVYICTYVHVNLHQYMHEVPKTDYFALAHQTVSRSRTNNKRRRRRPDYPLGFHCPANNTRLHIFSDISERYTSILTHQSSEWVQWGRSRFSFSRYLISNPLFVQERTMQITILNQFSKHSYSWSGYSRGWVQ